MIFFLALILVSFAPSIALGTCLRDSYRRHDFKGAPTRSGVTLNYETNAVVLETLRPGTCLIAFSFSGFVKRFSRTLGRYYDAQTVWPVIIRKSDFPREWAPLLLEPLLADNYV